MYFCAAIVCRFILPQTKHRIFELSNEIFDIIVIGNDHDSFGKIEKKWSSMVHPNSRIIDLTGKFEHLFSLDTEYYHL